MSGDNVSECKKTLKNEQNSKNFTKKALLCIGNPLRGDDAVGLEVGKIVLKKLPSWRVFFGEDVPENLFGDIRKFSPEILVVVDAMSGFRSSGAAFVDLSDEKEYIYSTHNLPMPVLLSYLRKICPRTFFLGVNANIENMLEIREGLSDEAKFSAKKAVEKLALLEKEFENKI